MEKVAELLAEGSLKFNKVAVSYPDGNHLGFTVTITEPDKGGSLIIKDELFHKERKNLQELLFGVGAGTATSIGGQAAGNFAKGLINDILGTSLDITPVDLGKTVESKLKEAAADKAFDEAFEALVNKASGNGGWNSLISQLKDLQNDSNPKPIIDLMKHTQVDEKIEELLNGNKVMKALRGKGEGFRITRLEFNTSTYELNAAVELHVWYDLGTVADKLEDLGEELVNRATEAGGDFADWAKREAGIVAKVYQQAVDKALDQLPPWVRDAADQLHTLAGEAGENFSEGIRQFADQVAASPPAQAASDAGDRFENSDEKQKANEFWEKTGLGGI